ncbi:fas apoptotic inhibitory molecule 1 [Aphelenchoides avenae]|nr:fas apoptotic inhibitory molecule 1 [Aphelenchus avenae]
MSDSDVVAVWNIPMSDKLYKIEFEHGTTTGKRVIRVNGREIVRHDWMFKLVGREVFEINGVRCTISVDAVGIFAYEYSITVGGKAYEKFREQQKKALQVWHVILSGEDTRICLGKKRFSTPVKEIDSEKDTMDVWVNGSQVNTTGEFVDDGTETHFEVGNNVCYIKSESSGKRNNFLRSVSYKNVKIENPSAVWAGDVALGEVVQNRPVKVKLETGKTYEYCACGISDRQPFCDHKCEVYGRTYRRPVRFSVDTDGEYVMCQCKHSGTMPLCDGTHKFVDPTPQWAKATRFAAFEQSPVYDGVAYKLGYKPKGKGFQQ